MIGLARSAGSLAALIFASACGVPAILVDHGTVSGVVISRGCIGAATANMTCDSPQPLIKVEFHQLPGGDEYDTVSGYQGRYSIDLPVGTYSVKVITHTSVLQGPARVSVKKGSHVVADYIVQAPYS
jgi:hypothetical protein